MSLSSDKLCKPKSYVVLHPKNDLAYHFQTSLSSDKFCKLDEPVLRLSISTKSGNDAKRKICLEMTKPEMDEFVQVLSKIDKQLDEK